MTIYCFLLHMLQGMGELVSIFIFRHCELSWAIDLKMKPAVTQCFLPQEPDGREAYAYSNEAQWGHHEEVQGGKTCPAQHAGTTKEPCGRRKLYPTSHILFVICLSSVHIIILLKEKLFILQFQRKWFIVKGNYNGPGFLLQAHSLTFL